MTRWALNNKTSENGLPQRQGEKERRDILAKESTETPKSMKEKGKRREPSGISASNDTGVPFKEKFSKFN